MESPARFLSPFNVRISARADRDRCHRGDRHDLDHHQRRIDLRRIKHCSGRRRYGVGNVADTLAGRWRGNIDRGLIGTVNGLIITRLRAVPFIATLGCSAARGLAKWSASEQTINVPATWVNELLVTVPNPRWLLVAPGSDRHSARDTGRDCSAEHCLRRRVFALVQRSAARACGIPTNRLKVCIYTAGLLFGLAG